MLIINTGVLSLILATIATARVAPGHHKRNTCQTDSCSKVLLSNANAAASFCRSLQKRQHRRDAGVAEQTCSPTFLPYPAFAAPCFEYDQDMSKVELGCDCLSSSSGSAGSSPFFGSESAKEPGLGSNAGSTSGSGQSSGNGNAVGHSGGASGAGPGADAPIQSIVTTDIVYTTITISPVTNTVGSGRTASLEVIDSTSTVTQTTTLTICNDCAVATETNTGATYITTTSSRGNGVSTEILSVHPPRKTIPVQSHIVFHNSTGSLVNPSQYPTGSGALGRPNPTSGSSPSSGAYRVPSRANSGAPVLSTSSLGASFAQLSITASASGNQNLNHSSAVLGGETASTSSAMNRVTSNGPFSSGRLSGSGSVHSIYSTSSSGTSRSSILPSGSGASRSALTTDTGYAQSYISQSATASTSAPYPLTETGSSNMSVSLSTATQPIVPSGSDHYSSVGPSGHSSPGYQPSGTGSLSIMSSRSFYPSSGGTKSILPSGTDSHSFYPSFGTAAPSRTGSQSAYPSSGPDVLRSSTLERTGSRSTYPAFRTGYTTPITPSGTSSKPFIPSGSGVSGSLETAAIHTSGSFQPKYPTDTGSSVIPLSSTGLRPYYPSSGTGHLMTGLTSGTASRIASFGYISSTILKPSGTASGSLYVSSIPALSNSKPFNASSAYSPTVSSFGTAPIQSILSSVRVSASSLIDPASSAPASPSAAATETSALPASVTSAIEPTVTSACAVAAPLETFKLQISVPGAADDGLYLSVRQYVDNSGDDAAFPEPDLASAATFTTTFGGLTTRDGTFAFEEANVDHSASLPSLLRFDSQDQLLAREQTVNYNTASIDCTTTGGTLSCTAEDDPAFLVFYLCPEQSGAIQVSANAPDDCRTLTLDVVATDGTPFATPGDCASAVASVVSSAPPALVTSAIEASKTSALAAVTSACVPSPLETFILQVADSDTGIDGSYLSLQYSGDDEFDDILTFNQPDPDYAASFSLAQDTNALTSNQGRYPETEVGNIHNGEDFLFRFDTSSQLGAEHSGFYDEQVACDISTGKLQCRSVDENQLLVFYSCDNPPFVQINTGLPPDSTCNAFTLNVQTPDGTPSLTSEANCVGVVTSALPSSTLPPVITPTAPTPTPTSFKIHATSPNIFSDGVIIFLGDDDADGNDEFHFAGGGGTDFSISKEGYLVTTEGTVSTGQEIAYLPVLDSGNPGVWKMHPADTTEVDDYSTCSISDGGEVKCDTNGYDIFSLCTSQDSNALRLRMGSDVPNGCEEITLTIFDAAY